MDQDTVLRLLLEGAFVVFLDVPPALEFGIDLNVWHVQKFAGMKMIPPGFHVLYYSTVSQTGETAMRQGFFFYAERKQVLPFPLFLLTLII